MISNFSRLKAFGLATVLVSSMGVLSGCTGMQQTFSHGYQINESALEQIPEGSSREQVVLALGPPSTNTRQQDGTEALYYISQKKQRPVAFAKASVIDQRVLAVYLDENQTVSRIANYGLKDGKVFDFIARVTPTRGKDSTFLGQILGGVAATPTLGR